MADFPFGSLVNAGLGLFGISQNNEMIEEQRALNDWQKAFSRENLEFAKYQYQDSKKYNSAKEQANRLRQAGINPAFALGAMSAGQASSVGGVSSPTLDVPPAADLSALGSVASALVLSDSERRLNDSQTARNEVATTGMSIDNAFRHEDWLSKLWNRDMDSWHKEKLANLAAIDEKFQNQTLSFRVKMAEYEMQYKDSLLTAQDITNHYLPFNLAEGVAEKVARQFASYATGRASLKQADAAIRHVVNEAHAFDAQYGGNPSQREAFFEATFDNLVQLKRTKESEEFKNFSSHNPVPYNESSWDQFNYWKEHRSSRSSGSSRSSRW